LDFIVKEGDKVGESYAFFSKKNAIIASGIDEELF
jgi:hypothetical protein